jgi:hypothetical protein
MNAIYQENKNDFMRTLNQLKEVILLPLGPAKKNAAILKKTKDGYSHTLDTIVQEKPASVVKTTETMWKRYMEFINATMDTVDIYGAGLAFVYVLNRTAQFIDKKVAKEMHDLFYSMVSSDVTVRPRIDQVLESYKEMMEQSGF